MSTDEVGNLGVRGIGPESPGCARRGVVLLTGGTFSVDPMASGHSGRLEMFDDGDFTNSAVSRLYGLPELANHEHINRDFNDPRYAGVQESRATSQLGWLHQLGLLLWLEQYSPDDLDPFWLDLEIGCLVSALDDLVYDADRVVEARLLPHLEAMLVQAERLRSAPRSAVADQLGPILFRALDLARGLLPESAPLIEELQHAYEVATGLARWHIGQIDWEFPELLDSGFRLLADRSLVAATHAGWVSAATGTSSVDWLMVPRGLLSTAEQTIQWSLTGSSLAVTIAEGPRPRSDYVLAFRAFARGQIVGVGPLSYDSATSAYRGNTRIADIAGPIVVDVFDPSDIKPARTGAAALAAEAERWAARAVTLVRLADGVGQLNRAAPALDQLQRSARLFGAARAAGPPDWAEALAACRTQAQQYLAALAAATGRDGAAPRADSSLAARSEAPERLLAAAPTTLAAAEWALWEGGQRDS